MSTPRTWSPYQTAFFDWIEHGTGSAVLVAVAGAGKTTVLVEGSRRMRGSIASAMYNKSAATEFQGRLAEAGISNNQHRAGTFHSFGYSACRQVYKKARLDERAKTDRLLDQIKVPREFHSVCARLVSLAKQGAVGLLQPEADDATWWGIVRHHDLDGDLEDPAAMTWCIGWAREMLAAGRALCHELIDFDDMIYMPVVSKAMRVWANDWLLVDEAQDTNPARRCLARKMLRPGGRAVFVGDPHQAIYGFTGADNDSLDLIRREFGCAELPLTISYRCPRAVVAEAQQLVAHIESHPEAPEGAVRGCTLEDLLPRDAIQTYSDGVTPRAGEKLPPVEKLTQDDAVLCRCTKPLVKLAFRLIRAGIACHVEGREIGQGLLRLATRWKSIRSIDLLREKLTDYLEQETAKLMAKKQEAQAAALADRVETLLALMEGCPDLACVERKVTDLFRDGEPTLTLSTVHKSKGREWNKVFILGRSTYMPSKWARQDWQRDQERNLEYVAVTRAKGELINVAVPGEDK